MIAIYHLHFTTEEAGLEKSNNLLHNHSAIMQQTRNSKLDLFDSRAQTLFISPGCLSGSSVYRIQVPCEQFHCCGL